MPSSGSTATSIELPDAGSSNGTQVNGVRLEPRGPAAWCASANLIVFGPLEFVLLRAGATAGSACAARRDFEAVRAQVRD